MDFVAIEGEDPFNRLAGWSRYQWDGKRQWIWQKYLEQFPEMEEIPDVGYPLKDFNVEQVIVLEPDVVIIPKWQSEYVETVIIQLEQAGIPTISHDYLTLTPEAHIKSTLLLGYVLDRKERAQEIVEFYTEHTDKIQSRLEEIESKPKPTVYIETGTANWKTYGNYGWGVIIEQAGGINIAEDKIPRTGEISPEYVLESNPDVIIITGSYWPAKPDSMKLGYFADPEESQELLQTRIDRAGWDTLDAINNGRVHSIHHGIYNHIFMFVPIQYFSKWFYPDEFEDLDPEESFKEFHESFLPVEYSGVWAMSLEK